MLKFPAEAEQGVTPPSGFSSCMEITGLFCGLVGAMFFTFLHFLVTWLFKRAPKCSFEVLSSVPKCMCWKMFVQA